jgi:hypothetical protein
MWVAAAFTVLLANAAYLWAFAEPSLFYFLNVALHVVLGIALTIVAGWYLFVRRPASTAWMRFVFMLLAAAALTGLVLTVTGATTPYRRILEAHVLVAAAGSILLAFAVAARVRRTAGPSGRRLAPLYRADRSSLRRRLRTSAASSRPTFS